MQIELTSPTAGTVGETITVAADRGQWMIDNGYAIKPGGNDEDHLLKHGPLSTGQDVKRPGTQPAGQALDADPSSDSDKPSADVEPKDSGPSAITERPAVPGRHAVSR